MLPSLRLEDEQKYRASCSSYFVPIPKIILYNMITQYPIAADWSQLFSIIRHPHDTISSVDPVQI